MRYRKFATSIILTLIIAALVIGVVSAYSVPVWNYNYVGSSDAKGTVSVTNGTTKWYGGFRSEMVNPSTNINVIGRTWWTVRELCEATWTQNFQYSGQYYTNSSSYIKSKTVTKQYCGGTRFGRSLGQHDFNHTGATQWRPNNDTNHVQVP